MAWTSVSATTVKPRLSATELTALQTIDLPSGVTDALTDLVSQVVDEVRGYIRTGGFPLGASGTLPAGLVAAAIDITRYRLAARFPVKILDTDQRRRAYEDAIKLLDRVSAGKWTPETPATPDTESAAGLSPDLDAPTLSMDRDSQDGI